MNPHVHPKRFQVPWYPKPRFLTTVVGVATLRYRLPMHVRLRTTCDISFDCAVVYASDNSPAVYRQLFLTDGALHLLVVDLHKFDRDPLSRGNAVYIWLDSLLCRVPGSAVLVVATHLDVFGDDHKRSAAALEDLEAAIVKHLNTKGEVRVSTLITCWTSCRLLKMPRAFI